MAVIRRVARSNPLSNFQRVAPDGGGAFRFLAGTMETAYSRVAPAVTEDQAERGLEYGLERSRQEFGNVVVPRTSGQQYDALSLIREFEGFRDTPYWDVNAYRIGFGTDTITDPDGTVRSVKPGDRVDRTAAERDLMRRVSTEFMPRAAEAVGEAFNSFSTAQQAVLASIAYNYGSLPRRIVGALRSGSIQAGVDAIRSLQNDNDGVNRNRRNREADIFLQGGSLSGGGGTDQLAGGNVDDTLSDPEPVPVTDSEGRTTYRKYSPFSGPILQAHDAAAKVAYQSQALMKGQTDLRELARQYPLDPKGFFDAAEGYVDQMLEAAPTDLASDLTGILRQEAHRLHLGVMDAQHADTRKRADNGTRALITQWSDDYTQAIVSGDQEAIQAAGRRLDSVLQARERLPGLSWTPEQSANVFRDAERAGEATLVRQQRDRATSYKDDLNLIIDAAKANRTAAAESILANPEAAALHPELMREAQAFVALRDNLPEFQQLTPDQQSAQIADLIATPVAEEWQLDVAEAAQDVARENRQRWEDDPVEHAGNVLAESPYGPPPELPELDAADPSAYVEALAARREYMNRVMAAGFTTTKAFLSDQEANDIGALINIETPPELRAAMAAAIVQGFGPDAIGVFDHIDGDPVTMFAGKMQALNGRSAMAASMLRGQQMLAENLVQLPPKSSRVEVFSGEVAEAMSGVPNSVGAQSELMQAASALYASQAQGVEPNSEAAKDLFAQSIQTVLGQETKHGRTFGGVQPVLGHETLLPIGVDGVLADQALRITLGGNPEAGGVGIPGLALDALTSAGMRLLGGKDGQQDFSAVWAKVSPQGAPMVGGQPIPPKYVNGGRVRAVPYAGSMYRLEIAGNAGPQPVTDAAGNVFFFDMQALLDEMR